MHVQGIKREEGGSGDAQPALKHTHREKPYAVCRAVLSFTHQRHTGFAGFSLYMRGLFFHQAHIFARAKLLLKYILYGWRKRTRARALAVLQPDICAQNEAHRLRTRAYADIYCKLNFIWPYILRACILHHTHLFRFFYYTYVYVLGLFEWRENCERAPHQVPAHARGNEANPHFTHNMHRVYLQTL